MKDHFPIVKKHSCGYIMNENLFNNVFSEEIPSLEKSA